VNDSYKKHQIFISSTYEDLAEERKAIFEAILEEGHMPAGMELFATSEKSKWSYITERIEDCDYYILIIAHRYGSVDDDGISFTEKEYRYALEKNIPIMAFIIDEKASTNGTKQEKDTTKLNGLLKFKEAIKSNGRMCQFFLNKDDLKSKFKTSLHQYIRDYPRTGWVRSDSQIIQERMMEHDIEFVYMFLTYQRTVLTTCIIESTNPKGESSNKDLNFQDIHNLFNIASPKFNNNTSSVYEVLIKESNQLSSSIQFLLNNQRIHLNYELSLNFFDFVKNTNFYLPLIEKIFALEVEFEPFEDYLTQMIKRTTKPQLSGDYIMNTFYYYHQYLIFINNWIIKYDDLVYEIRSKYNAVIKPN